MTEAHKTLLALQQVELLKKAECILDAMMTQIAFDDDTRKQLCEVFKNLMDFVASGAKAHCCPTCIHMKQMPNKVMLCLAGSDAKYVIPPEIIYKGCGNWNDTLEGMDGKATNS